MGLTEPLCRKAWLPIICPGWGGVGQGEVGGETGEWILSKLLKCWAPIRSVGPLLFLSWALAPHPPAWHTAPRSPGQCPPACGTQTGSGMLCFCCQVCVNFPGQYWKVECYLFLYFVYFAAVCWFCFTESDTYFNSHFNTVHWIIF